MTVLLRRLQDGEVGAADDLMKVVYGELRAMASSYMRGERAGHTLDATGLVHEAYLRLVDQADKGFESRRQFFGVASSAMRHVLVDHARARRAEKRGGGAARVSLDATLELFESCSDDMLALDEALAQLEANDEQLARIVELRFFGGLGHGETAEVLGVSVRTVERGWALARSWLRARLTDDPPDDSAR